MSKSTTDGNIHIDLSESSPSPTIICCLADISVSLPRLLAILNINSDLVIPLIVFVESSNVIDWNPLIHLISMYNLSLNIVNDEISFRRTFNDIIQNLVKRKISRKSISNDSNQNSANKEVQVRERETVACDIFTCFLINFLRLKSNALGD